MTAKMGRFALRWVVSASVVMVLTGCGEFDGTTGMASSVPTAVTTQPRGIEFMAEPCSPRQGFYPAADAYAGPAPHPVAVFAGYTAIWSFMDQQPEWMSQSDPLRYQLVVCLGISQEGGELIEECEFVGGKRLPQFRGRYLAKIYEAKSARLLGTEEILGSASGGCPTASVRFAPGERHWLFSNPDLYELRKGLSKYVYS
ncbi:hypothetical protein AB0H71_18735 [Nocardia sp. NPDC050697]|uniref:hypothetical protein n=1 Tax=Nocardia sp. NPDC050697 TaxID=3155158 RepID=UPI0033CCF9D6